ncbi:hypothetical protein ACCS70_05160 [Rhizobium ruizarguesonis]|uniref:Secreted protein n=1 Tax=Rhizobium beringeri TaxID=3019934 RepID=A0ABY1XLI6_9HYPH|nr:MULTISPECIES: hypothetical protein [Rhizobium]QIO48489.1 hypothetical protein HA464_31485 [Rhizobium leguminosarum bv. trifolii]MBY5458445.1 hypothetical protein [Rhizobium leguminosarum]MBY5852083.1 hypothetical protein [Rhizobium leguminosarum]NEI21056.1 hypothetical protein [Rhizobium ruizarguesonis]NEI99600.1 hypothetical protein [Rhizobium ruizarguesonis]
MNVIIGLLLGFVVHKRTRILFGHRRELSTRTSILDETRGYPKIMLCVRASPHSERQRQATVPSVAGILKYAPKITI